MTAGSAEMSAQLDEAEQALQGWLANAAAGSIAMRREIGDAPSMNHMAEEIKKASGAVFFDEFRAAIEAFIADEEKLLTDRRGTFWMLVTSGIAGTDFIIEQMAMVEQTMKDIKSAKDILVSAVDMETGMRGFLLAGDPALLTAYTEGAASFEAQVADLVSAQGIRPEQAERLTQAEAVIANWRAEVVEPALELRRRIGDAATMDDMADLTAQRRGKPYVDAFDVAMGAFIEAQKAELTAVRAENREIAAQTRFMIPAAVAAAIVLGAALSLFTGFGIANGIRRIAGSMKAIAGGDNEAEIQGAQRGDEVGEMARALTVFRDELARMQAAEAEKAQSRDAAQTAVVTKLSEKLSQLSKGDLTAQIEETFDTDYEQLRQDFNITVQNLNSVMQQVADAATSIRDGAEEITSASDDLSRRTESQAATLEETAAAMEQMTGSVKAAAEGARGVENAISEARNEAETNREVVESAVSAMTEIEESSNQISQIIGVIDDIAFQTNLLALNAGVEAARAGEAGRGFAVVASEVRALAQRSSEAATEIKALISNSSSQVERGVDLVGKAGGALQAIVAQVGHISGLVSGIAEGASEQSTGLGEINLGVAQLDQVTQQNAAMVEEATAASQLLNNDAAKLAELIARFETGGAQVTASYAAPSAERASVPVPATAGFDARPPIQTVAEPRFGTPEAASAAPFSAHGADADGGWLDMEPMPAPDGLDDFEPEPVPMKATGTDDTVWKDF